MRDFPNPGPISKRGEGVSQNRTPLSIAASLQNSPEGQNGTRFNPP
nr:MAG TPA: hypothetical protein [Caudoviricetes sp.]